MNNVEAMEVASATGGWLAGQNPSDKRLNKVKLKGIVSLKQRMETCRQTRP